MTPLECSGLVTLVLKFETSNFEDEFIPLPKGTDFANITDPLLYVDYALNRKALVVDVSIFERRAFFGALCNTAKDKTL